MPIRHTGCKPVPLSTRNSGTTDRFCRPWRDYGKMVIPYPALKRWAIIVIARWAWRRCACSPEMPPQGELDVLLHDVAHALTVVKDGVVMILGQFVFE